MKIGVVLVTYNRLEKLKVALSCYACQTYKPQYVLVVNNCSSDGTAEYLASWQAEETTFEKYVLDLDRNMGGSGGFYAGMQRAIGLETEWVWVSDDDAYPRYDALEKINLYYEALPDVKKNEVAAVCSAVYNQGQIHCGHRNHVTVTPLRVAIKKSEKAEYQQPMFEFNMLSYVGACIKASALKEAGPVEKDYFIYCDDQEHSLRLNKIGKFLCVTESIVDHDTPPFDERVINWGKFYFKRNGFLMIRQNYPFRYFMLRYLKRAFSDISIFSRKDPVLKKMYRAAYWEALMNRKGLHKVYRPGWRAGKSGGVTLSQSEYRIVLLKKVGLYSDDFAHAALLGGAA